MIKAMAYENTFKFSIIASFLIHGFLLSQLPHLDTSRLNSPLQEIEVTYYKLQMLKLRSDDPGVTLAKSTIKRSPLAIKKEDLPSPISKDAASFLKKLQLNKGNQTVIKQIHPQKKITLPEVKSENKIKNPKYNNYYQTVREKIRRHAYDNYLRYETGEVYLVFVVLKDGSLKEAKIVEEKSSAANYLKEVALKSVSEASPYPVFPEGLSYPELSFNVIISFEISE